MSEDSDKKIKILIVDDDEFLVNMYAAKFAKSGADVEAFKSGEALIERLKSDPKADIILLDIVIPGLDGVATLQKIRDEKLAETVPVVMLTNQSDEKDISRTSTLGVSGYIVKAAATPSEVVDEVLKIIKK